MIALALVLAFALGLLVFMFIQNKKLKVKNLVLTKKNQELKKRLGESRKSNRFLFNKAYDLETKFSGQTELVSILLKTIDRLNRDATDRDIVQLAKISCLKDQLKQSSTITIDPSGTSEMCGRPPPTYSHSVSKCPAPSAPPDPTIKQGGSPPPYTEYGSVGGF